jgi:hypothetical protein
LAAIKLPLAWVDIARSVAMRGQHDMGEVSGFGRCTSCRASFGPSASKVDPAQLRQRAEYAADAARAADRLYRRRERES